MATACGMGSRDRQGWDRGAQVCGAGMGTGRGVQGRLGCVGLAEWGALASQVKGTTSVWPQVGDERQCHAGA